MNELRQKIAGRSPLRGPFLGIPSPMTTEIVAQAQPDFVCIDTEHSPIGDAVLTEMIRAAQLHSVPALVRVRSQQAQNIAAALDAGACGILVPHVSTAAIATAVVRAARFPPQGNRGAGPARAAGYLRDIGGYIERARRDTVVMVQIETVAAVDNLPEILAVEGIDLVLVGPGDLAVDLAARPGAAPLEQTIDRILAAAAAADVPAGIFAEDRDASRRWLERLSFVIEGSDAFLLTKAIDAAMAPLD